MGDLFVRQMAVLRSAMADYRRGSLALNSLVQRIEGLSNVLATETWKDAIFPIVLSMEQVNAAALDAKRGLTEADKDLVESALRELEALIARYEAS